MTDVSLYTAIQDHLCPVAERYFPAWVNEGIPDYLCSIHSLGVTFWTTLGQALGLVAVGEMPALHQTEKTYGAGKEIISDSVWFRDRFDPCVLVEFERYAGEQDAAKLSDKFDNLLLAYHHWGSQADLLVLAYWTKGLVNLPNHDLYKKRLRDGFSFAGRSFVPGSASVRPLFFQFILSDTEDGRWKLDKILERGRT